MVFDPVQRVFFYDLPCSVSDFLGIHLPQLKLSLSLALREFRPLSGSLHLGSDEGKHEIRSSDVDAVPFTVAESGYDFYDLSGNHARDCTRFHPLVPTLMSRTGAGLALLALQIMVFPDAGVALGITISHAVADGTTTAHFLKTWAAACRLGKEGLLVPEPGATPSYDRSVVYDASSLERTLRQKNGPEERANPLKELDMHDRAGVVLTTFTFSREQIKKLGEEFSRKTGTAACSSFALVSGFIWACLVKAKGGSGERTECFGFVFEARARLEPPLPATYFGNCLGIYGVTAGGSELEGENGMAFAWTEIWKAIQYMKSGSVLQVTEEWVRVFSPQAYTGILPVAGSPRLGMYQVDFGWGRPRKVELISIERASAMSIAEWGEDERGLEIGLALSRDLMEKFNAIIADRLSAMSMQ